MHPKSGNMAKLSVIGLAILAAVAAGWWIAKKASEAPPVEIVDVAKESGVSAKRAAYLYFGDEQGRYLAAEKRVLAQHADMVALGRWLVQALIAGPEDKGSPTLPADARIRSFFVDSSETAFVDFETGSFEAHPSSVGTELLSIYSIVNTLVLNVEGIRSVKFLIGGQEAATLVGHTDLREPFEVDMLWVR